MWDVSGNNLTDASTTFSVQVTRVACNSGSTGVPLKSKIAYSDTEIVITLRVSPGEKGSRTCIGNQPVDRIVHLVEKIGHRALVDGECRAEDGPSTSSLCFGRGIRRQAKSS